MLHARLSPSSSSRWLTCTASVKALEAYENTTNASAEWGTLVHDLGEKMLKGEDVAHITDKEMLECAQDYADYVNSFIDKNSVVMIEEQFNLNFISEGQFGTSDATVLNGTHLHVFDLKTGHNIVDAENNTQLMLYGLGAIHELEFMYDIDKVTLHIVQTRANHISYWETDVKAMNTFKQFAQEQAKAIITGNTKFVPSEKGCKWCAHSANCEALKTHVDNVVKGAFEDISDIDGKADLIDTAHIKKILDNKELIVSFIKAVEDRALELMESGEAINGYKLVESRTNRKWRDEDEVAEYLAKNYKGVDHYQHKLLPMTNILKLHSKDKKLEEMLTKPEGKPVIAPNNDKRPALTSVVDCFDEC